mmetsp:Transcript_12313/g.32473  ORF Transcript_12313/g.32473 Transcript_12313/m.32473 type:complete len:88 (-) Transcript_12313:2044-2307(-)
MKQYPHPLLYAEHAHVQQREELARCCFGGCKGKLEGRKPSAAWTKVEEHAAEGSSSSSSSKTSPVLHSSSSCLIQALLPPSPPAASP